MIDGGKGQLAAGLEPLQGFRERGVDGRLAGQAHRGGLPARAAPTPIVLPHDTPELQLLQRVRDEAHRFAITHHRIRRDKAMTESIMDELPGIGPARKRALLKHFGSPEAVLGASREELESVPGLPAEGRARPLRPPQQDGAMSRRRNAVTRRATATAARRLATSRTSWSSPGLSGAGQVVGA